MLSKHKYLFTWTSLCLAFFLCVSICNADQNNNDNLTTPVTLHDWKRYSQKGKVTTCAGIILEATLDNNFNLPADNGPQMRNYAKQLASTIQLWIDTHNNTNDNESVQTLAIINMLQLNWIDEKYAAKFLTKEILIENKDINPSNAPTKTKIQSKRKLMSKKAGRDWVKHNLPLRSLFNLDDMVQRFGTYEKKTTGNVELYYFKRIDMTFFVFLPAHELVGFSESKPKH